MSSSNLAEHPPVHSPVPQHVMPSDAHAHSSTASTLLESAPIAIYHYEGKNQLQYANRKFREIFGMEAEQGMEIWLQKVHPEDQARVTEEWAAFDAQRDSFVGEFRCQYRTLGSDGSTRFVLETLVPAVGMAGFVGTMTDVTELVMAQRELEKTHLALASASRLAGMAEVATGVLHNVGNVLNSVNVSVTLLQERIRELRVSELGRVAALLHEQGENLGSFITSDKRGKLLPGYIERLSSHLLSDRDAALVELTSLAQSVEHIKTIIMMQQTHARHLSVAETVAAADLVNDSLRICGEAFTRHGITVTRELEAVPPILVDKHKVLQILINLMDNAKHACSVAPPGSGSVTIRVSQGTAGVCLSVSDNGVGIPAENLIRIFNHGFTTRPDGHGFGLHSAALAAQEMKGSLVATSAGPGCGATFVLELPLAPPT
jgi:two-component system, LuxR family, sensor kinase FixL